MKSLLLFWGTHEDLPISMVQRNFQYDDDTIVKKTMAKQGSGYAKEGELWDQKKESSKAWGYSDRGRRCSSSRLLSIDTT